MWHHYEVVVLLWYALAMKYFSNVNTSKKKKKEKKRKRLESVIYFYKYKELTTIESEIY
jgi:hypothetical protein